MTIEETNKKAKNIEEDAQSSIKTTRQRLDSEIATHQLDHGHRVAEKKAKIANEAKAHIVEETKAQKEDKAAEDQEAMKRIHANEIDARKQKHAKDLEGLKKKHVAVMERQRS
jgi:hypothetical protein